jgi:hypothetical protein
MFFYTNLALGRGDKTLRIDLKLNAQVTSSSPFSDHRLSERALF